jgi:hypothetical protein
MKVYHVTSMKKLLKYKSEGVIKPPVRAWVDVYEAIRFKTDIQEYSGAV